MSYRRSLSFSENEVDLRDYFDNNGKSDIVKVALRFYKENKDKVLSDDVKNELIKILGSSSVKEVEKVKDDKVKENVSGKAFKLIK